MHYILVLVIDQAIAGEGSRLFSAKQLMQTYLVQNNTILIIIAREYPLVCQHRTGHCNEYPHKGKTREIERAIGNKRYCSKIATSKEVGCNNSSQ